MIFFHWWLGSWLWQHICLMLHICNNCQEAWSALTAKWIDFVYKSWISFCGILTKPKQDPGAIFFIYIYIYMSQIWSVFKLFTPRMCQRCLCVLQRTKRHLKEPSKRSRRRRRRRKMTTEHNILQGMQMAVDRNWYECITFLWNLSWDMLCKTLLHKAVIKIGQSHVTIFVYCIWFGYLWNIKAWLPMSYADVG